MTNKFIKNTDADINECNKNENQRPRFAFDTKLLQS